jgi:hypothetical protein
VVVSDLQPGLAGEVATTAQSERGTTGERRLDWRVPALLVLFVCSRIAYRLAGVAFNTKSTWQTWIFLDTGALRDDLVGSLVHLHGQPPLASLLYGVDLQLPSSMQKPALMLLFVGLGIVLTVALYLLAVGVGISRNVAFIATGLFIAGPTCVIYENWFHYTYPVAVLLCFSGLLLLRWLQSRHWGYGLGFFATLATVVLTRSSYHLVLLIAVAALVALKSNLGTRRVIAVAIVPIAVVTLWYGKNLIVFGSFSSSSWYGMNLARTVYLTEGQRTLDRARADGEIPAILTVKPFSGPTAYAPRFVKLEPTDVPVLRDVRRRVSGGFNYNNRVYLEVSDKYLSAVLEYWRAHPSVVPRSAAKGLRFEMLPADDYYWLNASSDKLDSLDRWYQRLVLWQPESYRPQGFFGYTVPNRQGSGGGKSITVTQLPPLASVSLMAVLVYALALVGGAVLVVRRRKFRDGAWIVILYLWCLLVYGFLVTTLSDIGENNRFRFESDPIALVLALVVATAVLRGLRARLRHDHDQAGEVIAAREPAEVT